MSIDRCGIVVQKRLSCLAAVADVQQKWTILIQDSAEGQKQIDDDDLDVSNNGMEVVRSLPRHLAALAPGGCIITSTTSDVSSYPFPKAASEYMV